MCCKIENFSKKYRPTDYKYSNFCFVYLFNLPIPGCLSSIFLFRFISSHHILVFNRTKKKDNCSCYISLYSAMKD